MGANKPSFSHTQTANTRGRMTQCAFVIVCVSCDRDKQMGKRQNNSDKNGYRTCFFYTFVNDPQLSTSVEVLMMIFLYLDIIKVTNNYYF